MNNNMINAVINNLCSQLLTVQEEIANRKENTMLPTPKEVAMQVRMINSIDKLQKLGARLAKEQNTEAAAVQHQQRSDPSPFRTETIERYTYLLNEHNTARANDMVPIEGKDMNLRWVIYNIFQAYLPEEERMFIADEKIFRYAINMADVSKAIEAFVQQRRSLAA